jgi:hypothetical protein
MLVRSALFAIMVPAVVALIATGAPLGGVAGTHFPAFRPYGSPLY